MSDTIRLATFNIKHAAPLGSRRADPELLAEACQSLDADILALQEVDVKTRRSGAVDLAKIAADACGMDAVFAKTMDYRGGEYGNALLVKGEIKQTASLTLPPGYRHGVVPEPRNAILATACVRDRVITVGATHLATQRRVSRQQLPQVITALAERPGPHVLLGDFNLTRFLMSTCLRANYLKFAWTDPTYPADAPRKQIDHIGVKGLSICSVDVLPLPISDHRALIVDVQ